ncbi:MAG: DUF4157 domain-containing protein [Crocinitomix sp.]|nr:DUF4157 domain-containing protein [Crocinitomix sp.]
MNILDSVKGGAIQPKLKIGEPNDKFEIEADQMADQVMRMPAAGVNDSPGAAIGQQNSVQRKCTSCEGNELNTEEIEMPSVQLSVAEITAVNPIQPKSDVTIDTSSSAKNQTKDSSLRSMPSITKMRPTVQRKPEDEDILQKEGNENSGRGPPMGDFSSKLNQSKGSGQPMDSATNSFMSSRFGADFSDVKIHTGSDASSMSDSISAKAFTHQNNVYFNQGQYQPNSNEGKTLLAHELTHTIQQGSVGQYVQAKLEIGSSNDSFEQEADQMADHVMRKCATCEEESVQRKCSTCEEESVQRKCSKCGEKEELQRKPKQISRGPPAIQRYSWSDFTSDVSSVASSAYDTVAGVASDAVDLAGEAIGMAVDFGRRAYRKVRDIAATVVGFVSDAAEWLWDKIGQAANWAWDRIVEFADNVINKLKQAWAFAQRVARTLGGFITFQNGVLTITGPDLTLCPEMTIPLIDFDVDLQFYLPLGFVYMGDHITFIGMPGVTIGVSQELNIHFGPCNLSNTSLEVDILGASTTIAAELDFNAGLSIGAEIRAGGVVTGGAFLQMPYGGPRLYIPSVSVEAGGAGGVDGTVMVGKHLSFSATTGLFTGTTLNANDDTNIGLDAGMDFSAYAAVSLLGQNLCRFDYPLWEKRFQAAANFNYDFGLRFPPFGLPGVLPSFSLNNFSGVPYDQVPEPYENPGANQDCPLCDVFHSLGLMPMQRGVQWTGHPEPAWGGPLFAYPKQPQSLASGAKCRGACGPDCDPNACTAPEDKYVCENTGTSHIWHLYPQYTDCNTHTACRQHDHCYDWCAAGGEIGIVGPCHRWCDLECACDYSAPNCVDWARGNGASDGTMPFSEPPSTIVGCRGGCPVNIAADGEEPHYRLCLPEFELMERQNFHESWQKETGRTNLYKTFVEVPYIIGLWLGVDAEASAKAEVMAGLGPLTLRNVCMDVDPVSGIYAGTATLNAVIDLLGSLELTGQVHGWAADFACFLKVLELTGGLRATGTASLFNSLDYVVDIECVNGEIMLKHALDLESCLNLAFDLDAFFDFKIFGISAYNNTWDLFDWDWGKCWNFNYQLPSFGENEVPFISVDSQKFDNLDFDGLELLKSLFSNSITSEHDETVTPEEVDSTGIVNPCNDDEPPPPETPAETVIEDPVSAATAHGHAPISAELNVTTPTTDTVTLPGGHTNTVGVGMNTPYLTNHPDKIAEGSESTGSAQKKIYGFKKIATRGAFGIGGGYQQSMVHIKGHLLNGKTGGPAQDHNLYPISGQANSDHKNGPEDWVKKRVLNDQYLVYYQVVVENRGAPTLIDVFGDGTCTYYYMDSDYTCFYSTYKLYSSGRLERNAVSRVPVRSRFNVPDFVTLVTSRGCPQRKSIDGFGSGSFYEQQADRVADKVVGNSRNVNQTPLSKSISNLPNGNAISRKALQRKCATCEKEELPIQRKSWEKEEEYNPYSTENLIQRMASGSGAGGVPSNFNSGLNQSTGSPMDSGTMSYMENGFGTDFSGVKIHTGATANNLSNQIQAKAFTTGNDIYFNQGEYNPSTNSGKHLLAHELTHTIQQGASGDKVQREPETDTAETDTMEAEPATMTELCSDLLPVFYKIAKKAFLDIMRGGYEHDIEDFTDWILTDVNSLDLEYLGSDESKMNHFISNIPSVGAYMADEYVDYVGALTWLDTYLGLPPELIEIGGPLSYGIQFFIHAISEDLAFYLTTPLSTHLLALEGTYCPNYNREVLNNEFAGYVHYFHGRNALIELELVGSMRALLDLHTKFGSESATKENRIEFGEKIGSVSRRILLLNDKLQELKSTAAHDPGTYYASTPSKLAEFLDENATYIDSIRVDAENEDSTMLALGNGLELLKPKKVEDLSGIPMFNDHQEVTVSPDQAFPVETDETTLQLMEQLAARIDAQRDHVAELKEKILPENPDYSVLEYLGVYDQWLSFFSPVGRNMDPLYQKMDKFISEIWGVMGYAGVEGGIGRWLLFANLSSLEFFLGDANSGSYGDVIKSLRLQSKSRLSGSAVAPNYNFAEMYSGTGRDYSARGEEGSVNQLQDREKRNSELGFEQLSLLQASGGLNNHQIAGEAEDRGLLPNGIRAPMALLPEEAHQDMWSYLVTSSYLNGYEKEYVHEQRTISEEQTEYLLAKSQYYETLEDNHLVDAGDASVRGGGIETGRAANTSTYLEGLDENDSMREASSLRREMGRDRRSEQGRSKRSMHDLMMSRHTRDLERYLSAFYTENDDTTMRLIGVLNVTVNEHDGMKEMLKHFTPGNIAKAVLFALGIIAVVTAVRFIPYIGPILAGAIGKSLRKFGLAADVGSIVAIGGFLHEMERVTSFSMARSMGYLGKFIMDEIGMLLQGIALGAGMSFVKGASAAKKIGKPSNTDEIADVIGPLLKDSESADLLRIDLNNRKTQIEGQNRTSTEPNEELQIINDLIKRMDGGTGTNRPIVAEVPRDAGIKGPSLVKAKKTVLINGERHGMSITVLKNGQLVVRICSDCAVLLKAIDDLAATPAISSNPASASQLAVIRAETAALNQKINSKELTLAQAQPQIDQLMARMVVFAGDNPRAGAELFKNSRADASSPAPRSVEDLDAGLTEQRARRVNPDMGAGKRQPDRRALRTGIIRGGLPAWCTLTKSGVKSNWEAHHLIPWEFLNHGAFDILRANGGWNHNNARNGIPIPKESGVPGAGHLPVHQIKGGPDLRGHPVYSGKVKAKLDAILAQHGNNPKNLKIAIDGLMKSLRDGIQNTTSPGVPLF